MALITGVEASNLHGLFQGWWQFILVGFICVSVVLGSTFILYLMFMDLHRRYLKRRSTADSVSSSTKSFLRQSSKNLSSYKFERIEKKPSTYGVYLGGFENPPTEQQILLLEEWDLLILDPSQPGVLDIMLSNLFPIPPQVLARVDVAAVVGASSQKPIVSATEWISRLLECSNDPLRTQHLFTGIVISRWEESFSVALLTEFVRFIGSLGLCVYLEASPPKFLLDSTLAELDEVTGLVLCNGTISENGQERDAFQMAEMRSTIKAFVSQACLRCFVVLLCEILDDNAAPPLNAVIKRTYQLARFYNALTWIGERSSLFSAGLSLRQEEPMAAFDWLKESRVMKTHEKWRSNQKIATEYSPGSSKLIDELHSLFHCEIQVRKNSKHSKHSAKRELAWPFPSEITETHARNASESSHTVRVTSQTPSDRSVELESREVRNPLAWLSLMGRKSGHALSSSSKGASYDYLGCFPLGFSVNRKSFGIVVQTQERLREMQLLDEIKPLQLSEIGDRLTEFCNGIGSAESNFMSDWSAAMQELAQQLCSLSTTSLGPIRAYVGLDSGFQIQPGAKFWAVYRVDEEQVLNIYLSRSVQDLAGVILHTFLSSRGCPRHECFQAEMAFSDWARPLVMQSDLPPRLFHDISLLSPVELLKFLQSLSLCPATGNLSLVHKLHAACKSLLLDATDFIQMKEVTTIGYLSGRVSSKDLVNSRIQWYKYSGCQCPDERQALATFTEIDVWVEEVLRNRRLLQLQKLTARLSETILNRDIDARIDLIAVSLFCAMRRHAFDEAYLEVSDRNPLFNDQSDQAAAFAELFATGARCESYFDLTPSALGQLLSSRYRDYHHKAGHEPPIYKDGQLNTSSSYAAAKIDVDPRSTKSKMSGTQRFTFLSVFAIPALLDILLLSTTGRGLYLSSYMSTKAGHSATLALMISLLISGAVGTWITCGGSYYLISMAFSAMNMFVVTRLIAGLAFTLFCSFIGLAAVGAIDGIAAGVIFFLYLIALTSYLCLIASLATFSYPGSAFESGRPIIIMAIPVLFISPVLTIFVHGYDIYIYLSVIYIFVILLAVGVRRTGLRWTTWYLKIKKLTDQDLRQWYIETYGQGDEKFLDGLTDPAALKLARETMLYEIKKSRKWFGQKTKDPLVLTLAKSHEATVFLLDWYSGYSGTPLSIPYSSTWNMQTKVALQTLQQLQTGIRLHNAFIHWRQAGDEIGCSLLYFIVALLDKWNALLDGGQLIGFAPTNKNFRIPVGFALAYYLIGAVLLDLNAAKLHTMTNRDQNLLVDGVSSIPAAVKREVRARRYLYWTMLGRYLFFHSWSLAVASTLLWVFDSTEASTIILFMAYVGAYTGLLWYQYTKVFTGPRSLKPLIAAVLIGIPLGQLSRHFFPKSMYCDVVPLAVACWTAGILSLYYARIKTKSTKSNTASSGQIHKFGKNSPDGIYHAFSDPGKDPLLSQDELRILYNNLRSLRDEERYQVDPYHNPGREIKSVLLNALRSYGNSRVASSMIAFQAFPEATEILEQAIYLFETGVVVIDCIPMSAMTAEFTDVKAISYFVDKSLRIILGCEMMDVANPQSSISIFCRTTAEILFHAVTESFLGLNHDDATLAESLLAPPTSKLLRQPSISQSMRNLLLMSKPSSAEAKIVAKFCEDQALQNLAFGLKPDTDWERTPRDIRELVVRRCSGLDNGELTQAQREWLLFNQARGTTIKTFISRCNFGAFVALCSRRYALGARDDVQDDNLYDEKSLDALPFLRVKPQAVRFSGRLLWRRLKTPFSFVYHTSGVVLKLLAVAFVADAEFQREIDCALRLNSKLVRSIVLFVMTGVWRYVKTLQELLMPLYLLHGRKDVKTLWNRIDGTTITLKRQRIMMENTEGMSTGFNHATDARAGIFEIHQYRGSLQKEPTDTTALQRVSIYSKSMLLLQREDYRNGAKDNVYRYEYYPESAGPRQKRLCKYYNPRFPILRRCMEGSNRYEELNYNYRGLVQNGSYFLHGSLIRFTCHYRQGCNSEDELLRAEFVLPHLSCTVSWAAPPMNQNDRADESKWIPHSQVTEATFVLGADIYESRWSYDYKFHPTIHTTLNGEVVETPPIIQWDHLGVLKKPAKFNFLNDDPLIGFKTLRARAILRWLGLNTRHNQVSTSKARSRLWNAWKDTPGFDGVLIRWLDERLLRREPMLRPYWRRRDRADLKEAEAFLNANADGIMASVDLADSISGLAPLAIKMADLHSFGQGGDANSRNTRSKAPDFDVDGLQVLAVDSGTWPNEGGGVSACRRDMINNLRSVNWHMIAESANDSGLPKHQTERNVRSLKIIPLWGLDFLTPTHGLFKDKLDTEVEHVPRHATKLDVEQNFLPILTALVKGARSSDISRSDILQTTRALVNLNTYFSDSKHWRAVWTCRTVQDAWRNLWISQDLVSPTPSEGWFQAEIPTVAQLDAALELWFRYLFIFSIPIPDKIPPIFQASHHSVSASYGIVCKIKRGCTLQIWDHAISWRETNVFLSSDLCQMAPFIRNALLGLMRVTSQLTLHHADTILPCADFFNPGWEVEIGTSQGRLEHRNTFKRKIDPVVNGIPDMAKFSPIKEIKSKVPTVTMLSHVWYAKDIKTAILAADIIVNEWGFNDYKLDIYGAIDKSPSYSTDCFEIIASKSLPRYVTMCGEANPTAVLEQTWVFLNSSISEGLPLALGEAALTGAPVVCTDVGASLRVLTDPVTGDCFSSVVAPNDARNLARAQINLLALLDEWAPYANDPKGYTPPTLSDKPTQEDIAAIRQRMYSKTAERRALGMRGREIVQKSFGGARYLREHEQMLWIGKSRYELLHNQPTPAKPAPKIVIESLPVPSNVWGATSIPSAPGRKMPTSSVQASSMMESSIRASTLLGPGLRDLFKSRPSVEYRGSGSKSSTLYTQSVVERPPVKRPMAPRVVVLPRGGTYQSSTASSLASKQLPSEDTFFRDITNALEVL